MSYLIKSRHILKLIRWNFRRYRARGTWGSDVLEKTPAVFGNAMPKGGSHLIAQILQGLVKIGPFVNPGFPPVNRNEGNQKLSEKQIIGNITNMKPGDIRYGYIKYNEPFPTILTGDGRATIFVYRDPRDLIISHILYATDLHPEHGQRDFFCNHLNSMEERINTVITGISHPKAELPLIYDKYQRYLDWLSDPGCLSLRFEDLILDQRGTISRLLDYLQGFGVQLSVDKENAVNILVESNSPSKSGTFRKGKPGNWKEYFTPENVAVFKEHTGDLLQRLNYETDNSWGLNPNKSPH